MVSLADKCHRRGCKHTLSEHRVTGTREMPMFPCAYPDCRCQDFADSFLIRASDVVQAMWAAAKTKAFWLWWAKAFPWLFAEWIVCVVPSALLSVGVQSFGAPWLAGFILQLALMALLMFKVWPPIERKARYLIQYRKDYLAELDLNEDSKR